MKADASSLTLEGSYKEIWRITAKIAALCALVAIVIASLELAGTQPFDLVTVGFLVVITLLVPLILPLYVWLHRDQTARTLHVAEQGLCLTRFDGQTIQLTWTQIVGIRASSTDDHELLLMTTSGELAINAYVFPEREWKAAQRFIHHHLPPDTPMVDTRDDLDNLLRRWLNRGSVALLLLGLAAITGLLLWNPHNAAWVVVLTLSPPIFIFMGVSTPHNPGVQPVPVARIIGFYAIKALVAIPLGVLWYLYFAAKSDPLLYRHEWLLHLSNLLFFGAMAVAILGSGGWSAWQYNQQRLRGINRHWKKVLAVAIPAMLIGLALKCWNE